MSTRPRSGFRLFGPAHLIVLTSVVLIAEALARWCRRNSRAARLIRYGLATLLAVNGLAWYVYELRVEGFHFPDGLPLDLCDVTMWVTVAAAVSLQPWVFEFAYYVGLAGSGMALLTPDLWATLWSWPTVFFFLAHGMTVATVLTLVRGGLAVPRPGSPWRVLGMVNAYAAAIGVFDAIFRTNYMYLREKPAAASVLDYFGPWPFYLVGGELTAMVLFWLLWLPFRQRRQPVG